MPATHVEYVCVGCGETRHKSPRSGRVRCEACCVNTQPDLQRRLALSDAEYARLLELSVENDRTVAAEIRRAIRKHVA